MRFPLGITLFPPTNPFPYDGQWRVEWLSGKSQEMVMTQHSFSMHGESYVLQSGVGGTTTSFPWSDGTKQILERTEDSGSMLHWRTTNAGYPTIIWRKLLPLEYDGRWRVEWLNGTSQEMTMTQHSFSMFGASYLLQSGGGSPTSFPWSDGTKQILERTGDGGSTLHWRTTNAGYPTIIWRRLWPIPYDGR
eukprot:gene17111-23413_t